jgi:hypothetical protein
MGGKNPYNPATTKSPNEDIKRKHPMYNIGCFVNLNTKGAFSYGKILYRSRCG